MEQSTIYQRIISLINVLNMTQKAFCEAIKVHPTTLQTALSRQSDVGFSVLSGVLRAYPKVSAEWLMRGEGDMFRRVEGSVLNSVLNSTFNGQANIAQNLTINQGNVTTEQMETEVAQLRDENRMLLAINSRLIEQNNSLTKKI